MSFLIFRPFFQGAPASDAICPYVRTPMRHKSSSIETAERIKLVFGMGVSFHPSYSVLK